MLRTLASRSYNNWLHMPKQSELVLLPLYHLIRIGRVTIRMLLALHITWLVRRTTKARGGHMVMTAAGSLLGGETETAEMTGEMVKGGVRARKVRRQGSQTRVFHVWRPQQTMLALRPQCTKTRTRLYRTPSRRRLRETEAWKGMGRWGDTSKERTWYHRRPLGLHP
jgi:hypothetical protein